MSINRITKCGNCGYVNWNEDGCDSVHLKLDVGFDFESEKLVAEEQCEELYTWLIKKKFPDHIAQSAYSIIYNDIVSQAEYYERYSRFVPYQKEFVIKNQSELAKLLGISKNQLSNVLSDNFDPIKSNVRKIADFFEVSPISIIKENKENK